VKVRWTQLDRSCCNAFSKSFFISSLDFGTGRVIVVRLKNGTSSPASFSLIVSNGALLGCNLFNRLIGGCCLIA
jgi:hypothetical protein